MKWGFWILFVIGCHRAPQPTPPEPAPAPLSDASIDASVPETNADVADAAPDAGDPAKRRLTVTLYPGFCGAGECSTTTYVLAGDDTLRVNGKPRRVRAASAEALFATATAAFAAPHKCRIPPIDAASIYIELVGADGKKQSLRGSQGEGCPTKVFEVERGMESLRN